MKERCLDPKDGQYPNYGARGIGVCIEWQSDFAAFFAHIGPRPSSKHSLDRKDNDRDYEPGNVRWATDKEQVRNRRMTLMVEHDRQRRPLAEWCEIYQLPYHLAWQRIFRYGMPVAQALTKPYRYTGRRP